MTVYGFLLHFRYPEKMHGLSQDLPHSMPSGGLCLARFEDILAKTMHIFRQLEVFRNAVGQIVQFTRSWQKPCVSSDSSTFLRNTV